MKKQEIIDVLRELHKITGFRVSLHGADYTEIAAYPETKNEICRIVQRNPYEYKTCLACDKAASCEALAKKSTHIYRCRYGFVEAVSPLYNFGSLTGFLMMGQIFEEGHVPDVRTLEDSLCTDIAGIFDTVPRLSSDMINSYVKIMTICAQYLTLSNAVPNEKPTVAELAKRFIHENYPDKIGIKEMCTEIGCSKSTLITSFKNAYGITVNKYLTDVRLEEACKMLRENDKSICEIALLSGFSDQSYFSKVFSARYGIPPSDYPQKEKGEIAE